MLMEAPEYQFSIEIQTYDGWVVICRCNDFDRCIHISDSLANTQHSMTRVVDTFHDRLIVHERAAPEYIDDFDDWMYGKNQSQGQVNWSKEGF
jgi:hypothetical protein